MHVHRPGVAEVVEAPHLVQQLVAGEHPVGGGGQVVEQLQLLGGRIHPLAVHQQLVGVQVDHQLVEGELLLPGAVLVPAEAAEHRVDAGQHLLHLEGLDDVVVGAPLQAGHLVLGLSLGGEHDHRGLVALPDLLEHRPAVHHRQHDVQQHQVGVEGAEQLHALAAVVGYHRLEALLLQIEVEQLRNIGVVLHNQNLFRHSAPSFSMRFPAESFLSPYYTALRPGMDEYFVKAAPAYST